MSILKRVEATLKAEEATTNQRLRTVAKPVIPEPELDWRIFEDQLTQLFPDSSTRERVRRLLASANGTSSHAASSRAELAKIKLGLTRPSESESAETPTPKQPLTQAEMDRLSKRFKQGGLPE